MDRGAWWAAVHGVTKSWTRLSDFTFTFHFHALEKEMATHSSILAWRIPGMGEPGGLPSMGSHRIRYDWSDLAAAAPICWWIDIPHFVRKRGGKGGTETVVDQVRRLSYYYLRWDKIQGVGLGGVRKEGQKSSLIIKFERLVRHIPWILCMLSDMRVSSEERSGLR